MALERPCPARGPGGGTSGGATDELGIKAVENVYHTHDLHATILHQLGLDHEQLIYHQQGRDETLTDSSLTEADVVRDILV